MQDQDSGARTTATSQAEGRLKVDAGCCHGKKKCLKCAMGKMKDGKGGIGNLKKLKSFSSVPSSFKTLNKKMKFGKALKGSKQKSLKGMLKNIIK